MTLFARCSKAAHVTEMGIVVNTDRSGCYAFLLDMRNSGTVVAEWDTGRPTRPCRHVPIPTRVMEPIAARNIVAGHIGCDTLVREEKAFGG